MSRPRRKTRADLQREVVELTAQLASTYHFASSSLHKAGRDPMLGSGVLLTLHALGGRELICPVVIRDGLSEDTIAALHRDMVRSYESAVLFRPKAVKP